MMRFFQRALLVGGFFMLLFWGSSALLTSAQTATTSCPAGQFWLQCGASGGCAPTGSVCPANTSGSTTTSQCAQPQWWCISKSKCVTTASECDGGGTTSGSSCPSGQVQCPAMGSSPAGCYATCPTATSGTSGGTTQCSSGQMNCWDPNQQKNYCYSGTMCPMICMSGQVKCPNTSGGGEYCHNGTTCPTNTGTSGSTCPSGQVQCPAMGSSPAGCYATCPTATSGTTTGSTSCSSGQMNCWDPNQQKNYCYTGSMCPMICGSGMTKINCTDSSGKSYEMCASSSNPTCPTSSGSGGMSEADRKAECLKWSTAANPMQWCPPSTTNSQGMCRMQKESCDSTTGQTTCPATHPVRCQDSVCYPSGTDCSKLSGTYTCANSNEFWCNEQKKCLPSGTTCASGGGMTEEQMKTECLKNSSMKWCSSTGITKGFCAQSTWDCKNGHPGIIQKCAEGLAYCGDSPTRKAGCYKSCSEEEMTPKKRCEQQNVKEPGKWSWCKNQAMGQDTQSDPERDGWCADKTTSWYQPCDEQECKAKTGWSWCKSSHTNEWNGKTQTNYWCSKECPLDDEDSCTAAGREWCPNMATSMNMTPAAGMGKGWCAMKDSPPCTKKKCDEKKGAKWCTSKFGGNPWCSMNGACPDDEVVVFQWPNNKSQCDKYLGNWCKDKYSTWSSGGCMMATEKCMDPDEGKGKAWCWWEEKFADKWDDCQKPPQDSGVCIGQGRNWCEPEMMNYTPAGGAMSTPAMKGWCSKSACSKAGSYVCPDGKTLAKKIEDCPTKAESNERCWDNSTPQDGKCPPEPKKCSAGFTKDSATGECLKKCPNGKSIKEDESCSDVGRREIKRELTDKEKEVLKKKSEKITNLSEYATFFRQIRSGKIASEIEKLLGRLSDDQQYDSSYWTDKRFEDIEKNIAALKVAKEAAEERGSASDESDFKIDIEKAAIDEIRGSLGLTKNEERLAELLDATLPNLEQEGVIVSENVKNHLNDAAKLIEKIKSAETAADVNALGKELTTTLKTINDKDRPYLKGLLGVKKMTDWYAGQLSDLEMSFNGDPDAFDVAGLKKEIADAGYKPTANFDEINKLIQEARAGIAAVKAGKAQADPLSYLKRNVWNKLVQAQNEMDDIAMLLEVKDFIQEIEGKDGYIQKYTAELNKQRTNRTTLLKDRKLTARDRTSKARAALGQINKLQSDVNKLKSGVAQLKNLDKRGLKTNVTKLVDSLNDLIDTREGLKSEASLDQELRSLEGSLELPAFDLPALKSALLGAQGISMLFKDTRVLVRR